MHWQRCNDCNRLNKCPDPHCLGGHRVPCKKCPEELTLGKIIDQLINERKKGRTNDAQV